MSARPQTYQTRWVAGLAVLALLQSAAGGSLWAQKKKKGPAKEVQLVWPLPPDKPRIKYVTSIHGAADVEPAKKANFLDRLAGIERKNFKPTFVKPYGVATDSHGRVYVTDSGQGIIFVLDRSQKKVGFMGRTPQVRLRVPIGISVDGQDRVWVADAVGQHVYAFDSEDGTVKMALGRAGEMVNPTDVAVDDTRHRLYVVDSKQHCVLVYDSETGNLITKIGSRGGEMGHFNFPTNLALDRTGKIYLVDTLNYRVQIFDPDGKFLDSIGQQGNRMGQFLKPKGIALDSYQNIYVVDADFDNLQIFDQKKRLLLFLGGVGQMPGTFWLPAGIHIDRQNFIYIADQNNRRIQIFQLLSGETDEPAPAVSLGAPGRGSDGRATGGATEAKGKKSATESNPIPILQTSKETTTQ